MKSAIIFLSVALVLFTAVVAVLLATLESEDYRDILTWTVEHFTDYRISIKGPFTLDVSMTPTLAISDFRIEPDQSADKSFLAEGGKLKIQLEVKPLLTGTVHIRELLGENVNVAFTGGEKRSSTEDKGRHSRKKQSDITIPVLEKVALKNVKISYADKGEEASLQVNIRSFRIDKASDSGPMLVKGKGTVNDADFVIEGVASGGTLVSADPISTDLKLNLTAKSTKLFRTFLFHWLPDTGPVTGETQLKGSREGLALEGLKMTAGKPETVLINVKGSLGQIPIGSGLPVSDIDLSLSVDSHKPKVLFSGLEMSLPELATVTGKTRMHGSGGKLHFDGIDVQATEREGVKLDLSGSASLEQRRKKPPLGRLDLHASLKAPSIASFRHLLEAKALPDLAPASFTGHITGTTETLSLDDIVLQAGSSGPVNFTWRGRIGKVEFGADQPVSDVEIAGSFYAEKTSLLSKYAGVSIPDLGPLESTSRIVARKEGYGIDGMELLIGGKEKVRLKAKGRIDHVMRGTSVGMDGIDLALTITELDGQAFSELLGQRIAGLGKLSGSLSLSGSQDDMAVSDADLVTISADGLKISARGGVSHIRVKEKIPVHGVDIKLSATAPDMTALRNITGLDIPALGPLSASLGVNDRDKALIIDPLHITTGPEEKPTLLINGKMHPVPGQDRITGTLTFKTPTSPWSEKFLDHPAPKDHILEGDLRLSGKKDNETLEGSIRVGKTKIMATIEGSRVNERQRIIAKVSAPKIYLSDLNIYPEVPTEKEAQSKKPVPDSGSRIFGDGPLPFESLKKIDLSLDLDVDEVIGKDFTLYDLNLDVTLDNGLLEKRLPKLRHAEGFVSMEAVINTRGEKPELMVKVTAEDIDAQSLLEHLRSSLLLGGHLTMAVDLRSTGGSPREIASALKGEIGIAIENGKVKALVDLVGADAIDMVTTVYKAEEYQKLNCLAVTVAFADGIGTSQVMYIDTPDMRSAGKGTVNLQEETIDIVIQPEPKKSKLGASSPLYINGPLARPRIVKIPLREAARLTGEILMPYVFLPARALGNAGPLMKDDKDEESPCFAPAK